MYLIHIKHMIELDLQKNTNNLHNFYYFMNKIIKDKNIKTIHDLYDELIDTTNNSINFFIYDKYNITILTPLQINFNIGYLNDNIQMIIDTFGTCIIRNDILQPIVHVNKKFLYNYSFLNSTSAKHKKIQNIINNTNFLDEQQREIISFYPSYDGYVCVLFAFNDIWFLLIENQIYNFNNNNDNCILFNLFKTLFEESTNINILEKNIAYHFSLSHHLLGKCIYDLKCGDELRLLIHLYSIDINTLLMVDKSIGIYKNERLYFSCCDELLSYVDKINNCMISKGKLTQRGIYMLYYKPNHNISYDTNLCINSNEFFEINFDTNLYSLLYAKINKYKNIHQAYLVLYVRNECNIFLPFITSNYSNIIKRIHNSLSTIVSELLNIYFMTCAKNNTELYDVLPKVYKNIRFFIHGIFIKKRNNLSSCDNDDYNDDDLKISIELTDIYMYLKNELDNEKLIELYYQRNIIIKNIINNKSLHKYLSIFNIKCLDTMIQTELMFN